MNRRSVIRWSLVTAALCCVAACATHARRSLNTPPAHTLLSGGRERTYLEYLPKQPAGKPLVIALHGRLGTAAGQDELSRLSRLAERDEAVVVMPQGVDKSWADFRKATPASKQSVDDVAFLKELIEDRVAAHQLDATRVYMIGMSNGGFMTLLAACRLADKLAAVASITGGVAVDTQTDCAPARPVPVMFVMGDADPLVPYAGGELMNGRGTILPAVEGARLYAKLNGCTEEQVIGALPQRENDGTSVEQRLFRGCQNGAEVNLLTIRGGGHTWPGGKGYLPEAIIGKTSIQLDASDTAWSFFRRFQRQERNL